MIEIRAMTVPENKALQKFVQQKQRELKDDSVSFGLEIADWVIEHIYPELKEADVYPEVAAKVVEKTNELTQQAAEAQAKELVKNW